MLWRQGDIFIATVDSIPDVSRSTPLRHGVLAHGEVTGHSHRFDDLDSAKLYAGNEPGEVFVEVSGNVARIVHDEHSTIELRPGAYRVWRQREYSPERIQHVVD